MFPTEMDDVVEIAGAALALVSLPVGAAALARYGRGRGAQIAGAVLAPGNWVRAGSAVYRTVAEGVRGRSSGNTAFDAHRAETLRRLEEEKNAFDAYVTRLRQARDQAEFDAFIGQRDRLTTPPTPTTP